MTKAKDKILPIFIPHLGCPHDCVFCNQKRISGSLLPSCPEDVRKAVEGTATEGLQLAFYGGSFTALLLSEQNALLDAAVPYLKSGKLCGIRLSTRPDAIDEEILQNLKMHGVDTVELGVQSMDNEVLRQSGRGHTAADAVNAARLVKAHGFTLILQMMTGLPGSSREKDIETAKRLIAMQPDGVRIYPTVIIRDAALEDLWRKGKYAEHTVEQAVDTCAAMLPLFERAGIPVIRLGLNPTDDLSGGDAVGGAYHPALGELVKSRVLLDTVRRLLGGYDGGGTLCVTVGRGKTSQMTGQRRCNILALQKEYGFSAVRVAEREENGSAVTISVAK